jgi:hypothetical protein
MVKDVYFKGIEKIICTKKENKANSTALALLKIISLIDTYTSNSSS